MPNLYLGCHYIWVSLLLNVCFRDGPSYPDWVYDYMVPLSSPGSRCRMSETASQCSVPADLQTDGKMAEEDTQTSKTREQKFSPSSLTDPDKLEMKMEEEIKSLESR